MKKNILTTSTFLLGLPLFAPQAEAGSIHYRALENVFGEPVTTTATGTPQRVSEVATNMTILSQNDIRATGSRSLAKIIDTLVPGIDVLQSGRAGFDVGVRGYQRPNQPRLLVLIDGRQVFIDDYSRTIWEGLPVNIDDIQQIEIVKGPTSALFGSNAAGGVINIITTNPLYDKKNIGAVSLGTNGALIADATSTVKLGKTGGLKFSAGGMDENEFNTGRFSREDPITLDPKRRYLAGSGVFKLAPKVEANTEFTYTQGQETQTNFTHMLYGEKFLTYSARAGFSWETPYGYISNSSYFNHARTTALSSEYPIAATMNTDLFVTKLDDQIRLSTDHILRFGLEYRNRSFDLEYPSLAANPQDPKIVEDLYAGGATWLWTIRDNLSMTNAVRFGHMKIREDGLLPATDFNKKSDYSHVINALSINSGLVYKPTEKDSFRLTYGRGLQAPSLLQTGWSVDLPGSGYYVDVLGNPDLKPTFVQNYELGYDRKLPSLFSTLRLSSFYQLNQDVAGIVKLLPPIVYHSTVFVRATNINLGNSHAWGGEAEIKGAHTASGYRWGGSYSFTRIADSESVATILNYRGASPVHHFRLNAGRTIGAWEFDLNGAYTTDTDMYRRESSTSYRTPTNGYITLGGRVGYAINDQFTIAASGTQLNQARLSANPYPALERQLFLTFTGQF